MRNTELGHTRDPRVNGQAVEHVGGGAREAGVDGWEHAPARAEANTPILLIRLARDGIELGR